MKQCKTCKEIKSETEYRRYDRPTHRFYSRQCKVCLAKEKKAWVKANFEKDNERNKAYNKTHARRIAGMKLVKNYWPNLTWEEAIAEWTKMYVEQDGRCYFGHETDRLHVDHCHTTKRVRGLLCYNCNNALGRLKDDVDLLAKAIIYLKKHKETI